MTKAWLPSLLFLAAASIGQAVAGFAPLPGTNNRMMSSVSSRSADDITTTSLAARRQNWRNEEDPLQRREGDGIPQLPAFRGYRAASPSTASSSSSSGDKPAFVNRKLELQYTCKVCETRNCHKVSRIAYNKGVVIVICKGCMSQHLISDNLGFTQQFDGNIEEYFKEQGEESVSRVNEDVFNLEKVLGLDTKGGSILGSDGETYLE